MSLLCCNRTMLTQDNLSLTPSFGKRWHIIKKLYCTNCGVIKLLESWADFNNNNQYKIHKKNALEIFEEFKLKPHIKTMTIKYGTKSNIGYAYGYNIQKYIKKTNEMLYYQYRVDWNGTKTLVKINSEIIHE